ncbi:MAG: HD domain-containing phosphohydrolase [Fusobacteriaceae bacterium]
MNKNKNKVINVYFYNPNHIYFFQKENGKLAGVYIDFFKKITYETGLKFNITVKQREDLRNILKNGEGDIVFNSSKVESREKLYYYLRTLEDKFIPENEIPASNNWLSVNKNSPELYSIIKKSTIDFSNSEILESLKKERPIFYKTLLKKDKRVLALRKKYSSIKVLLPPSGNLLPFVYKYKNKNEGYAIDRLNELSFVLGIPLVYTNNPNEKYDIKAVDSNVFLETKSEKYIPYYKIGIAVFSRISENFIDSSEDVYSKSVGFISTEDLSSELLKKMPQFEKSIKYKDSDSALEGLLKGEIDYLYGDFKIIYMAIENKYLEKDIKVSGFLGSYGTLGFGVPHDVELFQLLNIIFPKKLFESNILQSELKLSKKMTTNYKYFLFVASVLIGIILILVYLLKKMFLAQLKEKRITKALVHSFEAANELNDEDTGHHILRVNLYSKFLAQQLKCSSKFINEIGEYASLHDIGKIGISDTILKKPGKLTEDEFEKMKQHVILGKKLIDKMELGSIASNIALYHHERWNGNGYCHGLKSTKIPLEARIVALADVYDALRQPRVYKEGFSHEKAVDIIQKESGEHFDPDIVKIFLGFNEEFDNIFRNN